MDASTHSAAKLIIFFHSYKFCHSNLFKLIQCSHLCPDYLRFFCSEASTVGLSEVFFVILHIVVM